MRQDSNKTLTTPLRHPQRDVLSATSSAPKRGVLSTASSTQRPPHGVLHNSNSDAVSSPPKEYHHNSLNTMNEGRREDDHDTDDSSISIHGNGDIIGNDGHVNARGRRGQREQRRRQHFDGTDNDIEFGYCSTRRRTSYENRGTSSLTPAQIMEQESYLRYAKVAIPAGCLYYATYLSKSGIICLSPFVDWTM